MLKFDQHIWGYSEYDIYREELLVGTLLKSFGLWTLHLSDNVLLLSEMKEIVKFADNVSSSWGD